MPEYLAPGVYVEEKEFGPRPIEGVSTSTTGFVGMAERGPVSGIPVLVTSFADFVRVYGDYFDFGPTFLNHNLLPYAVDGFFQNGGKRAFIMRVAPGAPGTGATVASATTRGGLVTRLRENPAPGQDRIRPVTLRGLAIGAQVRLRLTREGVTTDSANFNIIDVNRATGEVQLSANLPATPLFEARFTTLLTSLDTNGANDISNNAAFLGNPAARPASLTLTTKNPGSWGRRLTVNATHESSARAEFDTFLSSALNDTRIRLRSGAAFYAGAWVEIDQGNNKYFRRVNSVNGTVLSLNGPVMVAGDFTPAAGTTTMISTCEFRLALSIDTVTEVHAGLTLENIPGRFIVDRLADGSDLVEASALVADTSPMMFPSGSDGATIPLDTGGTDGTAAPTDAEYAGVDNGPNARTGIQALIDIDQISIIAAPGITSQTVQNALITQCELLKDRFAILDPAPGASNTPPRLIDVQTQRQNYDTKYAAIYYPRIVINDPLTGTALAIPPSGHMAGIYARVDNERGVHKAPANEVIRGINSLEVRVTKGEQEILNPSPLHINVLRDFRTQGRGLRVWGARVITSDQSFKYINVRRLFIFIEESLEEGLQDYVFEPNNDDLWARVRQSITLFLTRVWRDGALLGRKPEEAFFVLCDRTTMTQDDIDNGRLICIVGIAPVKPAEFVIIRIGQFPGGGFVEEL